ncbi:NACHT domain-containing protein [Paenibacillus sp. FSL R7-0210]|uniref:NACHT domain-containing protein n=1 Tax=Paenibacillus sp. FSL R7-0210 TaxID=2921676 RepID=UPI0030F58F30
MKRDWNDFKSIYGGIEGARANFEEACESVIRKLNPNNNVSSVRANPGDEGIDVFVGDIGVNPIEVYQCKFFLGELGVSQKKQIRDSFNKAINSEQFKFSSWYLCLPKVLDLKENKWWTKWKKTMEEKHSISIHLKQGNEIIEIMKEQNVYNFYFKIQESIQLEEIHRHILLGGKKEDDSLDTLASEVHELFIVLGYGIEGTIEKRESYYELAINIKNRRGYDRILVHCICDEIGAYHYNVLLRELNERKFNEAWVITARRKSKAACEMFERSEQLFCYTLDELIDQHADFSNYIEWLDKYIKSKEIEKKYVLLSGRKMEIDPENNYQSESKYEEDTGGIEGYLDRWLSDPSKKHMSILGDFGSGKTWCALHYAWNQLQRYLEAKKNGTSRPRLPLFIPLRDYAKAVTVESLFSEFFFRKHEIPLAGYSVFEHLNKQGKFLLIFDGFDEMASKVDKQKMINNFWEIAKVINGDSKVILTCRNEHFPESKEGRDLLNAELKASTQYLTGESPQFEVIEVMKFNKKQIREVLLKETNLTVVNRIMKDGRLTDLAKRPLMIELILEALPEIEEGRELDISRVYLYAVSRKMIRDIKSKRTFTSLADKLFFLSEISWEMLYTNKLSINYRSFPSKLTTLFKTVILEDKDLDHWQFDMMGQTILIRNDDGDYKPFHKSLIEFFSAYKLLAELGILDFDFLSMAKAQSNLIAGTEKEYTWSEYFHREVDSSGCIVDKFGLSTFETDWSNQCIGDIPLTKTLIDLMKNMIKHNRTEAEETLLNILTKVKSKELKYGKYMAANIITLLVNCTNTHFHNEDFSNLCLDYAIINNGVFKDCNFNNSSFKMSKLTFSDMKNSTFHNCSFDECIINRPSGGRLIRTAFSDIRLDIIYPFDSEKESAGDDDHTDKSLKNNELAIVYTHNKEIIWRKVLDSGSQNIFLHRIFDMKLHLIMLNGKTIIIDLLSGDFSNAEENRLMHWQNATLKDVTGLSKYDMYLMTIQGANILSIERGKKLFVYNDDEILEHYRDKRFNRTRSALEN